MVWRKKTGSEAPWRKKTGSSLVLHYIAVVWRKKTGSSLVLHYIAMVWRKKTGSEAPWRKKTGSEAPGASPCYDDVDEKVPRGHVPMVAGCVDGDGDGERVLVPVRLLRDPCIAELLDMAAQRYGYGQPGVLRIPCDASHFRRVVDCALQRASQAA